MKIISGTFGVSGSAHISSAGLVIDGAKKARYSGNEIESISASVSKERKFGWLGFIVGAVVLSVIFGAFLSVIGVVIGIALAVAGSFYNEKTNLVDMAFAGGDAVVLKCSRSDVDRLIALKG